jgi:hypothetical protein
MTPIALIKRPYPNAYGSLTTVCVSGQIAPESAPVH